MENVFSGCEKGLTDSDIALIERDLGVSLPREFLAHYQKFNGGRPQKSLWKDPAQQWGDIEVSKFISLRYRKSKGDDPDFTIEGFARKHWESGNLPGHFLPFSHDDGANVFCIDLHCGAIHFLIIDPWNAALTEELRSGGGQRYVAGCMEDFVNGLVSNHLAEEVDYLPIGFESGRMQDASGNAFDDCGACVRQRDFRSIEDMLSIALPDELREVYSQCNGGMPRNTVWVDPSGHWDDIVVANLIPMLYDKRNEGEGAFTLENIARTQWANRRLPPNLLPFALDWGANFFCIDLRTKGIYYFLRDVWSDNISTEKNFEVNARYIAGSLTAFLDALVPDEDVE